MSSVSVIIPTFNRFSLIQQSIESWRTVKNKTKFQFELIYIDNGSSDGTVKYLQQISDLPIKVLKNNQNNLSRARNLGIYAAQGQRLIFTGDDIFPSPEFIDQHVLVGQKVGKQHAVLGHIDWHPDLKITHLMKHITEIGCEQFDFQHLTPESFTNFQHFYTSNVSVDRSTFHRLQHFFDESFTEVNFEDTELAFRLQQLGSMVFYTKKIHAFHYHSYKTPGFFERQLRAGHMAVHFKRLQPASDSVLQVESLVQEFNAFNKQANSQHHKRSFDKDYLLSKIQKFELLHDNDPSSYAIQRTLSDYYFRLFQWGYSQGILEALKFKSIKISSFLSHKYYMADPFARNITIEKKILKLTSSTAQKKLFQQWLSFNPFSQSRFQLEPEKKFRSTLSNMKQSLASLIKKTISTSVFLQVVKLWRKALKLRNYTSQKYQSIKFQLIGKNTKPKNKQKHLSVITHKLPPAKVLQLFFNHFDTNRVHLYFQKKTGLYAVIDSTGYYSSTASKIEKKSFVWDLQTVLTQTHLLALKNIQLCLEFHNLDYLILETNLSLPNLYQHVFNDQVIHPAGTTLKQSVQLVLGKVLRMPYLQPQQNHKLSVSLKKILTDFVAVKYKPAEQRLKTDLVRLPHTPTYSIKKTKPLVFVFPTFLAMGGVEKNTSAVIEHLKHLYDFVVINFEFPTSVQGSLHAQFTKHVVGLYDFKTTVPEPFFYDALKLLKFKYQPDLVWICNGSPWLSGHLKSVRSLFVDCAIVDQQVYDTVDGWISEYNKPEINELDRFIAVNKRIKLSFTQKYQLPDTSVDLIYPALDPKRVKSVLNQSLTTLKQKAKKYGIPVNKRILVFVGRLTDQKRPDWFLKIAEKMLLQSDWHFVMIGNGELALDVNNIIKHDGLNNVTRINSHPNPCEILLLSQALIVVSKYEGLPISLLESLAVGTPFFSVDVGGIRDMAETYGSGYVSIATQFPKLFEELSQFLSNLTQYSKAAKLHQDHILTEFNATKLAAEYHQCFKTAKASRAQLLAKNIVQ